MAIRKTKDEIDAERATAARIERAPMPTYPESSWEGIATQGRGIQQGILWAAEKAGWMPEGTFQRYTDEIRQKAGAYKRSLEGATPMQKFAHGGASITAGTLPYVVGGEAIAGAKAVAGVGRGVNYARTIASQAIRGGVEGGLTGLAQPAYAEGDMDYLTQKGISTGVGVTLGMVLNPLGQEAVRGAVYAGGKYGVQPVKVMGRYAIAPVKRAYAAFQKAPIGAGGGKAVAREVGPLLEEFGFSWDGLGTKLQNNIIREARRQLNSGQGLDPDALARKAILDSYEFRPTRAQITRNRHDATLESDLMKMPEVGEDLYQQHAAQPGILKELMEKEAKAGGAILGDTHETVFGKAFDALDTAWRLSQEEVRKLYAVAKAAVDENGMPYLHRKLGTGNLQSVMDENGMDYFDFQAAKAVRKFITDNPDGVTVLQAEGFRRGLSESANSTEPAQRWAARRLIDALDDDVVDSVGSEPFRAAREAARARFQHFDDKLIKKFLGDNIREDLFFRTHVIGGSSKRLKALVNALKEPPSVLKGKALSEAREEGGRALDSLRGAVWDHLMTKAVAVDGSGTALRIVGGDKGGFVKALDNIGMDRLKVLFSMEEIGKMYRLGRAGALLPLDSIPGSYINRSNTGSMILNTLNRIMKRQPAGTMFEALPRLVGGEVAGRQAARATSGSAVTEHVIGEAGETFMKGFNRLFPKVPGVAYGQVQGAKKNALSE